MPDRAIRLRCGEGLGWHGLSGELLPAKFESLGTEGMGQKAEVTDAHEAFGQNMYADIPGASLQQAVG